MTIEQFPNSLGEDFTLSRYPIDPNDKLRAWDASDELLVSHLSTIQGLENKNILIMNDSFGAIAKSLKEYSPYSYTDSFVAFKGHQINIESSFEVINDLDKLPKNLDLVLIKLPKNMSFFEDSLARLSQVLNPNALVICAGMIKHTPNSAYDLLAKYIGETRTSLAKKKARLIMANFTKDTASSKFPLSIKVDKWDENLINHSNLFSREKLDIGTRFFLEHIPTGDFKKILDLGCANGIIGMQAKKQNPEANIIFADESYMAIKSAKENFSNSFENENCQLEWQNCYEDDKLSKVDLVLCNPPFHQNNTVGDFIAWQMFKDAHKALNSGGLIRVIGNRHLGYHVKLKRIFKNSNIIASNKKFVIIDAYK